MTKTLLENANACLASIADKLKKLTLDFNTHKLDLLTYSEDTCNLFHATLKAQYPEMNAAVFLLTDSTHAQKKWRDSFIVILSITPYTETEFSAQTLYLSPDHIAYFPLLNAKNIMSTQDSLLKRLTPTMIALLPDPDPALFLTDNQSFSTLPSISPQSLSFLNSRHETSSAPETPLVTTDFICNNT